MAKKAKTVSKKKPTGKGKPDVKKTFETILNTLNGASEDVEKFVTAGNSAAGGRIRKAAQECKKLLQTLRLDVQAIKNAGK